MNNSLADMTMMESVMALSFDRRGRAFKPRLPHALDFALAGAALIDLVDSRFLDIDLNSAQVFPVRLEAPNHPSLVSPHHVAVEAGVNNITTFLTSVAQGQGEALREFAMEGLLAKNLLVKKKRLFGSPRFVPATVEDAAGTAVRRAVLSAIEASDEPPFDIVMLICLADPTGLLKSFMQAQDLVLRRSRIAYIRRIYVLGELTAMSIEDCDMTRG